MNALCDCVCHSGLFAGENCSGKLIGNPATFWWHTLPVNHIQCVYIFVIHTETLYRPTLQVVPSSDGVGTLVTVQPPSPVVPSATIVSYQLIISGTGSDNVLPVDILRR